jgi:hypothetical protein
VVLLPWVTVWLAGLAEIVKSGGGLTTSVTLVPWLSEPLVATMLIGKDPVAAFAVVVTFKVDVPLPATEVGLNAPDAPAPKPEALKLTVPVNPFTAVTVTV